MESPKNPASSPSVSGCRSIVPWNLVLFFADPGPPPYCCTRWGPPDRGCLGHRRLGTYFARRTSHDPHCGLILCIYYFETIAPLRLSGLTSA